MYILSIVTEANFYGIFYKLLNLSYMNTNEYITIDPKILVGKPVIKGTRIPVTLVLNLIANGQTINEILGDYPNLTEEGVKAALKYAEDRVGREEIYHSGTY